jgi:hypothetical protein
VTELREVDAAMTIARSHPTGSCDDARSPFVGLWVDFECSRSRLAICTLPRIEGIPHDELGLLRPS